MPKRTDIKKILVIGSGPIIIGQAAEFDYSGTQACKALREEGYKVVLVNSNPATIMTDPNIADTIYIEPLTPEIVADIIRKEKPDGLLPTMGGQTGLNLAFKLHKLGVLDEVGVKVLGTSVHAIEEGEDRDKFKELMIKIGEPVPKSKAVLSLKDAEEFVKVIGFPVIIRPAYTLGGTGSGIAHDEKELKKICKRGLMMSMISQVLIEEAILGVNGWGEFEMEVMRDKNDNCIIICPMENFDPLGYHTGDSIVTAPTQTLNDFDFQTLRTSAIKIIRALRVEGGCNIQFGLNYNTGDYRIIEVNPRVSRSSALASKATGYPIARIAAKIAIGMTLDEIPNDVTKETKACFEPTIDYVVVKIPRWPFDKFRTADKHIGTQMKSTGESMAIGRTFEEALQKAIRSLDIGRFGLCSDGKEKPVNNKEKLIELIKNPTHERVFHLAEALRTGFSIEELYRLTGINKWFLNKLKNIVEFAPTIKLESQSILSAKKLGFSDRQISFIINKSEIASQNAISETDKKNVQRVFDISEDGIRKFRLENNIVPVYKMVDTCAAEFEAVTPYMYSTYETEDESRITGRKKILIIGGGPIRIGQGIEFDYCCVHAVFALREEKIEAIIINNNPETVSTDFDISDKLYFEPLAFEDVMNLIEKEKPYGVIVQFGGQTPINLAMRLHKAGVNVLGTSADGIDIAEDRKRFTEILNKHKIPQADYGTVNTEQEALETAKKLKYPVLVRPSYVLGGRAMQIVFTDEELLDYMKEAVEVSPEHPVLIDKFLNNAIEVDVDALSDTETVFVAGIMEHIEEAGIHSGDSACVIPPQTLSKEIKETIIDYTKRIAIELKVIGLINIQYAVQNGKVFVIEANPRASRTVPYVSKSIGVPLAKIATKLMLGKKLKEFGLVNYKEPNFVSVKEAVFPFLKLMGVDPVLSPEMKSTGEVMGIDEDFGKAFYKAEEAAYSTLPTKGNILLTVGRGEDKSIFLPIAKGFAELGFKLYCTEGTHKFLQRHNIQTELVPKIREDPRILHMMKNKEMDLVINIPKGSKIGSDGYKIRRAVVELNIPYITTVAGSVASLKAIKSMIKGRISINSLDGYYEQFKMKVGY